MPSWRHGWWWKYIFSRSPTSFDWNLSNFHQIYATLKHFFFSCMLIFPVTTSAKAGLVLPVARIRNKLKEGRYAKIIGTGAAVYMAGVLQYLTAEVLDCAGIVAANNKKRRITPRHLTLAVRNDSELDVLFKGVTIPEGGVRPSVHPQLLQKPASRAATRGQSGNVEWWGAFDCICSWMH